MRSKQQSGIASLIDTITSQNIIASDEYAWKETVCPLCHSKVGYYTKGDNKKNTTAPFVTTWLR